MGLGGQYRNFPAVGLGVRMDQHAQVHQHAIRAVAVRLVDDKQIRDLHDARFHRLHRIARLRDQDDDCRVCGFDNIQLGLADPNGFDDDDIFAKGVQEFDDTFGGVGEAAVVAARRHTADKYPVVEVVLLHANAVAQDGTAGKRAGGIDSDNAHCHAQLPHQGRQFVRHRTLAGSGRTGDANAIRLAQLRIEPLHDGRHIRTILLDPRDQPG
jgi:hypothetical protein